MALETQVINLPVAAGMNELQDERLLDLPFMASIVNGVFRKDGSISKRYGTATLTTTGLPTPLDPNCVFDHNGQLAQHTPHGTYTLSEDNTRWRLASPAATRPADIVTRAITREGYTTHHDSAVLSNMVCYAWQEVNTSPDVVWVCVVELDTGAYALVPTKMPTTLAHRPKVLAFDNTFVIAAHSSTTLPAPVYAVRIPTASLPLAVSAATRIDNTTDINHFDCFSAPEDTSGHFAFSSTTNTYIAAYNKTLTLLDSDTMARDSDTAIACHYNSISAKLFVATKSAVTANVLVHSIAWDGASYGAPSLDVFSRAPTGAATAAFGLGLILGEYGSTGTMFMADCVSDTNSNTASRKMTNWVMSSAGAYVASSEFTVYGYEPCTKMYRPTDWEAPVFGVVSVNFASTPTSLLVTPYAVTYGSGQEALAVYGYSVLGRFHQEICIDQYSLGGAAWNSIYAVKGLPRISLWSSQSRYVFARTVFTEFVPTSGTWSDRRDLVGSRQAGNYVTFSVTPQPLHQGKCNSLSVFDGGMVSCYDGLLPYENTPHQAPRVVISQGAAGAGIVAGTYGYAYYFYFEDSNGNIHRGPIFYDEELLSVERVDIRHAVVAWPISALDGQFGRYMKMAIYRTTRLEADPNSLYYKIVDELTPSSASPYVDVTLDVSLTDNEQLYVTGEVLESGPAPALADMVVAKSRAFGISNELPNVLWYTKPFEEAVAPEWSPESTLRVPDEGGEVIALGVLDDKIVVFKERSIYYFFGEGPNALGQDGSFSDIRPISIDVGCDNKKTLVSGPFGIMFQAHSKGFCILGRDLVIKHVANVEDTMGSRTINAATLVPLYREIRFTADGSVCLAYNYLFDRWTYFDTYPSVHACMWGDLFVRVQSNYNVYKEDSTAYTDGGTGYTLQITTPWIKLAGLQSFKRVQRVGIFGAYHAQYFKAEVGYNYESSYPVSKTWTSGELAALDKFQVSIHLPIQKCVSVRFRFKDHGTPSPPEQPEPLATGAGYTLAGLALTVGLKKNINKHLPDGAKK